MAAKGVGMRKVLVTLFVICLMVAPTLVPNVQVTSGNITISTSGSSAHAWNLVYELCKAGVPGMCDLYSDGLGILW
jgi:hypothetical protein